jgi:hypothetical protein
MPRSRGLLIDRLIVVAAFLGNDALPVYKSDIGK